MKVHEWRLDRPGIDRCARPDCPWYRVDLRRGQGYTLNPDDPIDTLHTGVPECGPVREPDEESAPC